MQIENEIRELRDELEPTMRGSGHFLVGLDNEEFTGRLRHWLMTLTGGDHPVGFECKGTKTLAGDYFVTLVSSGEANARRVLEPLGVPLLEAVNAFAAATHELDGRGSLVDAARD